VAAATASCSSALLIDDRPLTPSSLVRELALGTSGYPGARRCRVLALANPLAESPMETRIRLALVLAGLPTPTVQHRVQG
jgi:hypothetical protein